MAAVVWRLAGVLALGALAMACASGEGKRETSALIDSVERYRRAGDAERPGAVDAMRAMALSEAPVREARDTCAAAADATTRALGLMNEVRAKTSDLEGKRLAPDAPEAQALPRKLDEAETLLASGRRGMTDCERRLADLRVRYGS
jgi:hypothetical protein